MTFQLQLFRLRESLREKVKQGLLTESGMARSTGVSQSHLHNVLKGIRVLPPELADRLMIVAGIGLYDLIGKPPPIPEAPVGIGPLTFSGGSAERNSCYLPEDAQMEPYFQKGDLVFFDDSEAARLRIDSRCVYIVLFQDREWARYVRRGGNRLYLAAEGSLQRPAEWEFVSLVENTVLDIIKGKILWVCRRTDPAEDPAV